jgi:ABC-2 type transport system ATP-binding protein
LTDSVLPVEVQGLVVEYDGVRAVDGLDLTVRAGDAVGLVGRNGAGKSTTMRVLAGLVPPSGGSVRVGGVDARKDPSAAKWYVGYCPDTGGLIPRATPWEHLQLAAAIRGMPRGWEARAKDLLDRFDLTDAADRVTAGFSHGMGRRTSVVLAAFHEPDVLLLDEPFDGSTRSESKPRCRSSAKHGWAGPPSWSRHTCCTWLRKPPPRSSC